MTRQAQWDIVTGVGITALAVAAGRAMETHRHDGLVTDPYAEAFVHAARSPVPMPTRPYANEDSAIPWASMATYLGVRSRFFDEFFALRFLLITARAEGQRAQQAEGKPAAGR